MFVIFQMFDLWFKGIKEIVDAIKIWLSNYPSHTIRYHHNRVNFIVDSRETTL